MPVFCFTSPACFTITLPAMRNYHPIWRSFFAVSLIAIAIQQIIVADFRPVIVPPSFPSWLPARMAWTWVVSLFFILMSAGILFKIKAREASLILGGVLFLFVLLLHVPYELGMYPAHLGSWTDPLKCLTLSGGAFVVAGSFPKTNSSPLFRFLETFIPVGKYFLAITMFLFGIAHFVYADFVQALVPVWIPPPLFWTYFGGVALVAAGVGIIGNIKRRLASLLLGIMLFTWFLILHLPRAIADPHSGNGNEWTSVFEALAFSGIAFLIAGESSDKVLKKE